MAIFDKHLAGIHRNCAPGTHSEDCSSEKSSWTALSVLALMRSDHDRSTLSEIAEQQSWELEYSPNIDHALQLLTQQCVPVLILEQELIGVNWQSYLKTLASSVWHPSIIVTCSEASDPHWETIIRCGGYDVVTVPLQKAAIESAVCFAWNYWHKCFSGDRQVSRVGSR